MALSNAERQARYRNRHLKSADGEKVRMSLFIDLYARLQLERIARHQGCTVTALIEKWAAQAEQRIVNRMTPKEEHAYYADDVTP
jgi:predicted DNA-binding ribbon-helix-helix protein